MASVISPVLQIPAQAETDTAIRNTLAPAEQEEAGSGPFKDLLTQRKRAVDDAAADTGDADPSVADHSALGLLQAFIQQDVDQVDPSDGVDAEITDTDARPHIGGRIVEGHTQDTRSHTGKATPQDMLELAAQRTHLERNAAQADHAAQLDEQDVSGPNFAAMSTTLDAAVPSQGIARLSPATTALRSTQASSQVLQRSERTQMQSGAFQPLESFQTTNFQQAVQNSTAARTGEPLAALDAQGPLHNAPHTGAIQSTGLPHTVAPAAADQIQATVGSRAWAPELGQHVARLGNQAIRLGNQQVELRLDPPDLGPLRITLSLQDGIAQASFVSPHIAVRQAVESALPQLQQALNQAGIALGEANVGDPTAQQRQEDQFSQGQRPGSEDTHAHADSDISNPVLVSAEAQARRPDALIDLFV